MLGKYPDLKAIRSELTLKTYLDLKTGSVYIFELNKSMTLMARPFIIKQDI